MAASTDMSDWIKFFTAAGIPPGPAAKYAVVFLENRIQKSMLMDLTKEYLKEMGISIMGDVIAVLKYAKTAHVKYENEKPAITALQTNPDAKVEVKRQSTPGNRMLEHYMRKEGIMEGASSKVTVSPSMAVRLGAVPTGGNKKSSSESLIETAEVVPVKRPRMVKPEEEGGYVISMPKGSTPKTQKILEQKQSQPPQQQTGNEKSSTPDNKKSTVFARLGSGGSTTTTPASQSKTQTASFQSPGGSSIFSRLGGKRERIDSGGSDGSVVEYQGVLKSLSSQPSMKTPKAPVVKITKPTTMKFTLGNSKMASAAPKESLQTRLGKASATPIPVGASVVHSKSLQARLGAPVSKHSAPLSTAGAKPKVTVTIGGAKKTSALPQGKTMMDRLGIQKPEVSTTTATHMDLVGMKSKVRDRLGGGTEAPSAPLSGPVVQLNKRPASVKQTVQARLGASTQTETKKPANMKQTVTVTLGGKPRSLQERLQTQSRMTAKVNPAVGARPETAAKMLKRITAPVVSPVPPKQSRIKERLGLMRAEATSTTPSVTVTLDGGGKSQKNVFSRLGS